MEIIRLPAYFALKSLRTRLHDILLEISIDNEYTLFAGKLHFAQRWHALRATQFLNEKKYPSLLFFAVPNF